MAAEKRVHGIRKEIVRLAVPVTELRPFARNARRGRVPEIVASLEAHGQYRPVVARKSTGEVLAGNHTLAAVLELGWTHVAATWVDVDDDQAARIVLVDNRTNDVAGYDDQALASLLEDLADTDRELEGTGFDRDALDRLLDKVAGAKPAPEPEPLPEPAVYGVAVAVGTEEQRSELIARLEEWGYEPRRVNGTWSTQES
ncbi:ParB N-terminal domain-containing protein [Patulibacter brassicae]|uniref:ParB N-terminal domain-containing protein n=1 Tax=Patulibacter brassicae TaxID=1705717 RepID=A0ABU4VH43_9ACTN|nr:ParB N-terminal domain-containing protein [Patulibacter brassicae]MDX8151103.1 ParB N-terminal domain-containing protein [Patulibacter brassicae]